MKHPCFLIIAAVNKMYKAIFDEINLMGRIQGSYHKSSFLITSTERISNAKMNLMLMFVVIGEMEKLQSEYRFAFTAVYSVFRVGGFLPVHSRPQSPPIS